MAIKKGEEEREREREREREKERKREREREREADRTTFERPHYYTHCRSIALDGKTTTEDRLYLKNQSSLFRN
jgi:hypothetical protein